MFSKSPLALTLILISMLSLFEEVKLSAIINWIFHVSDFLRSFMMSFKYVLILLRYPSTDYVLFLSSLLSYSIQLLLQKVPTLLLYNNLHA